MRNLGTILPYSYQLEMLSKLVLFDCYTRGEHDGDRPGLLRYFASYLVRCTSIPGHGERWRSKYLVLETVGYLTVHRPPEFRVCFTAFFVGKPNKHLEFTTRAASTRWLQSASEVSTVYQPLRPYVSININRTWISSTFFFFHLKRCSMRNWDIYFYLW